MRNILAVHSGWGISALKKIERKYWIILPEFTAMLTICYLHALSAGHYADFYPVNGTFQNFNPVRRLLAGQVPYRDFVDYLGMGHLYLGSVLTALLGGDYQGSLVAFTFLTFFCLAMLSFVIGCLVFGRKEISLALTNIILLLVVNQPDIFEKTIGLSEELVDALTSALTAGNSARFVRGLILPLIIALFFFAVRIFDRVKTKPFISKNRWWIIPCATGILAGIAFIWSNDYGISSWVCIAVMTLWIGLARTRHILKAMLYTGIEILASIAGIFVVVEIFTVGHFTQWVSSTFGIGDYQSWYYINKTYYIYEIYFNYLILSQACIAVVYLLLVWCKRGTRQSIIRYGILGFANMTCFCAMNEYKLLSGGGLEEITYCVLFFTIIYEALFFFVGIPAQKQKYKNALYLVSAIISISWILATIKEEAVFWFLDDKDGEYVAEMGGNMTNLYIDLQDASSFLNGEDFFATYASAQEVMEGIFQPSGVDYIIHVLGDSQREAYLDSFLHGEFEYAATIKGTYAGWEYWVKRANWFFYRELYRNWHPVFSNSYELYWARNAEVNQYIISGDCEVTIADMDSTSKRIEVRTDSSVNGVADVYLDYSIGKEAGKNAMMVLKTCLEVEDTGNPYESENFRLNHLRSAGAEYVPVTVIDGYGEITISSNPIRSTYLELNEASCDTIYTVTFDYVECNFVREDESGRPVLLVPYSMMNQKILFGTSLVEFQGEKYTVSDINEDNDFIYLSLADDKAAKLNDESLIDGNLIKVFHD